MLARWGDIAEGIGDDAAVLSSPKSGSLVVSTDASIENVHFRREWLSAQEIAYRSTVAALSDLAAVAAKPIGMLLALTIPDSWRYEIDSLADGIGEAARSSRTKIVGGDLSEGESLSFTITVLGESNRPLLRSTARPGDRVYVTGELGGAQAALSSFMRGETPAPEYRARFAHPVARIQEALWLTTHGASAGIDISDGLTADLSNIVAASNVCVSIDVDRVPAMSGVTPLDACASGEEYELIVSSPGSLDAAEFEREFGVALTEIAVIEAGKAQVQLSSKGQPVPVPEGYLHFSK
jgi:thiamine-monophosphate kinase